METQGETKAPTKGHWQMSARDAALWAVKISLACNVLLIFVAVILGALMPSGIQVKLAKRLFDALTPGFDLWNVMFGGPWHNSFVWFFSSLALNFIIYSGAIFIVEIVFIFWRRWLYPVNTNSRTLFR